MYQVYRVGESSEQNAITVISHARAIGVFYFSPYMAISVISHHSIFGSLNPTLWNHSRREKRDIGQKHHLLSDIGVYLSLDLFLENVLQRDSIRSEFRDTLTELLDRHLLLVEVEAEVGLVIDVRLLFNVERRRISGVELLGHRVGGVVKLLKKVGL
jgi:hypothetical protein